MTALLLLSAILATDPVPKVAPEPLPPEPKSDPTNVRELYDAYRYYGLPLPPKGSYLVKLEFTTYEADRAGKTIPQARTQLALVTDEPSLRTYRHGKRVEATRELMVSRKEGSIPWGMNLDGAEHLANWLCFAAQSHHLGWDEAAKWGYEQDIEKFNSEEGRTPLLHWLKEAAWHYHFAQLPKTTTNLRDAYTRLQRTLCPHDKELFPEQLRQLNAVKRSMRTGWYRAGTAEDAIEGLVQGRCSVDDMLSCGLDAIPVMIRHLDDDRLIRGVKLVDHGAIAIGILYEDPRVSDLCRESLGWYFTVSEVNDWYLAALSLGEKKWCVEWIGFEPASATLRLKYPELLPGLFRGCVGKPQPFINLLDEVAKSRLPLEEKRKLFRFAEQHPQTWPPLDVIRVTRAVDAARGTERLAQYLDELNGKGNRAVSADFSARSLLFDLLHEANDPGCWKRFRTLLPEWELSARMWLTRQSFRTDERQPFFPEPARCLLVCLDDQTPIPTETEGYKGSPPGIFKMYGYRTFTLANFAAMKLAEELKIDIPWKPDRTAAEWAAIREKVRAAAEKELSKK